MISVLDNSRWFRCGLSIVGSIALLSLAGCATTRTVAVDGYQPEQVSMSSPEADVIDRMQASEPAGDAAVKCDYWKRRILDLKPDQNGALAYAERKGGGWCERAAGRTPAPTPAR